MEAGIASLPRAVRTPLPNIEPGSCTVFCNMPDAKASPKVIGVLSMAAGVGAWGWPEEVPASGACAALILDDKGMEPVGISRSSIATGLRSASAKEAFAVPHGAQGENGDGGERATGSGATSSCRSSS